MQGLMVETTVIIMQQMCGCHGEGNKLLSLTHNYNVNRLMMPCVIYLNGLMHSFIFLGRLMMPCGIYLNGLMMPFGIYT